MLISRVSFSVLVAATAIYLAGYNLYLPVVSVLTERLTADARPLVVRDDPQLSCARNYTVAAGDTCNSIATAQNVSTFQLTFNNPAVIGACGNLQAGQNLCLGFKGQDCATVQVVVQGDDCSAITSAANVTLTTLLGNNPNINANCTNVIPDEVLCTASQLVPYSSVYYA